MRLSIVSGERTARFHWHPTGCVNIVGKCISTLRPSVIALIFDSNMNTLMAEYHEMTGFQRNAGGAV